MADSSTYSRIYELKTTGLDQTLRDINTLISAFDKVNNAKNQAVSGNSGGFEKTLTEITTALQGMTKATEQTAQSTTQLNATIKEFSESAIKGFSNVATSANDMNGHLTILTTGANTIQTAMEGTVSGARDYQVEIERLGSQLAELKLQQADLNKELAIAAKALNEDGENIALQQERYEALTVSLSKVKTEISEVNGAMNSMNKVYSPALNEDQTGNKAIDNETLLQRNAILKLQAKEELSVAGSMNEARTQAALLRKQLYDLNIATDEGKVKAEEYRLEIEKLDTFIEQNADKYTKRKINIGNYPTDEASVLALKGNFDLMNKQFSQMTPAHPEFEKTNIQLQEMKAQLNEVGLKAQIAGEQLSTMEKVAKKFTLDSMIQKTATSLARMIPHMILFTLIFEGINKMGEAIMESIPGTDAFIEKEEKLYQANEALAQSFAKVGDELLKLKELAQYSFSWDNNPIQNSIELLKEYESVLRAKGVIENEVAKFDDANANASKATKQRELDVLQDQLNIYKGMQTVLETMKGDVNNYGGDEQGAQNMAKLIKDYFPKFDEEDINKLVADFTKQIKDAGGRVDIAIKKAMSEYTEKAGKATIGVQVNESQTKSIDDALQAKRTVFYLQKAKEFENQKAQLEEQFRQKKYDLDVAKNGNTNAKIIANNKALFDLQKKQAEDKLALDLKNLPENSPQWKALKKQGKDNINELTKLQKQKNEAEIESLKILQQIQKLDEQIRLANNKASRSEFTSAYGSPEYGKLSKAIDDRQSSENLAAYKDYIELERKLQSQGVTNFTDVDNDYTENQLQRDSKFYKERLGLAKKYFDSYMQEMNITNGIILRDLESESLDAETKILNGGGSKSHKDKLIEKQQKADAIKKADEEIAQATIELTKAIDEQANAYKKLADAKSEADREEGNKSLQTANNDISIAGNKISKAKHDKAIAQQKDDLKVTEQLLDAGLQFTQNIVSQEMELWAKRDAYKEEMAKRAMDWNKKESDATAQSNQQKIAEDKAFFIAQQQLSRQKMIDDKKRAEAQAELDYGIAATSMLAKAMVSGITIGDSLAKLVIGEAALAATFASKMAILQSAPTYAEGTGSHTGGLAWVGDGGESELVKIGKQFFTTPSSPTLVNMPSGAQVAPFSQLGGVLQPPVFGNSSNSNGGGGPNYSGMHQSMQMLHSNITAIAKGMANMQVNFDTIKGNRAMRNSYHKEVKL